MCYIEKDAEITKTFMVPEFTTEEQVLDVVSKLLEFSKVEDTTHLEYGIYLQDQLIGFINDCGIEDEEKSLVCITKDVPSNAIERDDGWKAFRIQGVLDFSLIGILSRISGILAENEIGIFAISTYNTDYVLTKKENFQRALDILKDAGYKIIE